ncbi:MAG: PAS domain-containing protein, partial [Nitrospinae bacterium]|nr:PAS domain-containing protein [Nitrospinota bacterium]
MMRIKTFLFSLRGKAIISATLFVVIFMGVIGYAILSREKALYLKDKENQAVVLVETAGINFTNAILYQEVGLIEETGVVDHYISDLLNKEKDILTIIIFDNTGMVMAHCHLFEHGKFYEDSKEVIAHEATLVREVKNKDRGPILEAITPLMIGERRLATLRIEFSLKDFYEKLTDLGKRIFLLTIIAISGSIFLMVIGINAMTRPIRRLSRAMDIIDYGRFDDFSESPREDEIGHLQRSFMGMVRRLKEADLQWENTFNSITDLITIHDRDFRIVKANIALAHRLGTTTDGLRGKRCWEIFHDSNGPSKDCLHAITLKTGQPATAETEYPNLEGTFLTTTFPVFNERREVVGTVHIAKDITQEKRFQEKLIQSEKMAAMGHMASGIAHEINNPLNSILGYATYLLEETQDGAKGREELDRIARASKRCKETVKRFLDFGRETPKKIEPVNIKEAAADALSMCHHPISSQRIEVMEEIESGLYINGDKGQMEDVFVNLILNACQAMDNGGELTIKAYRDNGWIKVRVSDTGCGIPEENLNKIFDPFFTTKEPGKGTGLGLSVSHTIIKNHGGTIDCES